MSGIGMTERARERDALLGYHRDLVPEEPVLLTMGLPYQVIALMLQTQRLSGKGL